MSKKSAPRGSGPATTVPIGYADWLADIKARVVSARQRAALAANAELIQLYWRIGRDILERKAQEVDESREAADAVIAEFFSKLRQQSGQG